MPKYAPSNTLYGANLVCYISISMSNIFQIKLGFITFYYFLIRYLLKCTLESIQEGEHTKSRKSTVGFVYLLE